MEREPLLEGRPGVKPSGMLLVGVGYSQHRGLIEWIFTGTPGRTSSMKPGDVFEVEIEGVGVLSNPIVAAD